MGELYRQKMLAEYKLKYEENKQRWNEAGERLVFPSKLEEWKEYIKKTACEGYVVAIEDGIITMERLKLGEPIEEIAKDLGIGSNKTRLYYEDDFLEVRKLVTLFSERGPEFYRTTKQIQKEEISQFEKMQIDDIEKKNKVLLEKEIEKNKVPLEQERELNE